MSNESSSLHLAGKMAKKLLKPLSVGEKITLTVTGTVEELSMRDDMAYVMKADSEPCYCVRVDVTKVERA